MNGWWHYESASTAKKKMMPFTDSCLGTGQWTRMNGCTFSPFLSLVYSFRSQNATFVDIIQPPTTIASLVDQSITCNSQSKANSLLIHDLHLHKVQPAQATMLYFNYFCCRIETIKFMHNWNALNCVPNGCKLKSEHLQQLFHNLHLKHFETIEQLLEWKEKKDSDPDFHKQAQASLEELHQLFLSRHSYLTKAWNSFQTLYEYVSSTFFQPWSLTSDD